jgi:hypothetical protein
MSEQHSDRNVPAFNNHQEAFEFYLSKLVMLRETKDSLRALREVLVYTKASMRINVNGTIAEAVANDAHIAGQLELLELLIASGNIVTVDK